MAVWLSLSPVTSGFLQLCAGYPSLEFWCAVGFCLGFCLGFLGCGRVVFFYLSPPLPPAAAVPSFDSMRLSFWWDVSLVRGGGCNSACRLPAVLCMLDSPTLHVPFLIVLCSSWQELLDIPL